MPAKISPPQRLYLDLIEETSFNELAGPAVVASLLAHQELWYSAVLVDEVYADAPYGAMFPEVLLRDLPSGENNCATLWLVAAPGQEAALEALAGTWHADEIDWNARRIQQFGSADLAVLRVWWD